MSPYRRALSLAVVAFLSVCSANPHPSRAAAPEPPWRQLLAWLPDDTETLIVSQGPFTIPDSPKGFAGSFDEFARLLPILSVIGVADGRAHDELKGRAVLCGVEGSRRFSPPKGFGLMPYEGAHLAQFEPAAEDAVRRAFQACLDKADKQIDLAGQRVAVFTGKEAERESWALLVARPKPCLLVCACDQSYLEEVLRRAGGRPGQRALPDDLPEWRQVDLKAPVWAVRHYRKDRADKDPSSPLGEHHLLPYDPDAVGLVLWYNGASDKSVRLRYLSGAKGILEIVNEPWKRRARFETKPVGPGCVEVVVTKGDLEKKTDGMLWISLWGCLGHYIYL